MTVRWSGPPPTIQWVLTCQISPGHLFVWRPVLEPASSLLSQFGKWHGPRLAHLEWVGIWKMPGQHLFICQQAVAPAFSSSPTMVVQGANSVVGFPANAPENVIETMATERDKWHSKMQSSKVYSALVQAQRSHLQKLSALALFWVSFIQGKFPSQTAQIPLLAR